MSGGAHLPSGPPCHSYVLDTNNEARPAGATHVDDAGRRVSPRLAAGLGETGLRFSATTRSPFAFRLGTLSLQRAGHGRRFEETAVVHQTRVAGAFQFVEQLSAQSSHDRSIRWIGRHIVHLVRVLLQVKQLLARPLAVRMVEVPFPLRIVSMVHQPRFGGPRVFVGQRGKRVLREFLCRRRIVAV